MTRGSFRGTSAAPTLTNSTANDTPNYGIIRDMEQIQAIIHKCEAPETGYWAEVPSLPGCVTQGETLDEVRAMIRDAVNGWFEAAWALAMRGRRRKLAKTDIMEPVFA